LVSSPSADELVAAKRHPAQYRERTVHDNRRNPSDRVERRIQPKQKARRK